MDKKIIIICLLLSHSLSSIVAQNIFISGETYARQLYHSLDSVLKIDFQHSKFTFEDIITPFGCLKRRKAIESFYCRQEKTKEFYKTFFFIDGDKIEIHCSDTESIRSFLSHGQGNYIVDISNEIIGGDNVLLVSFYSGSGIIRRNVLVFKECNEYLNLQMLINMDIQIPLSAIKEDVVDKKFWRTVYAEIVDYYELIEKNDN